MYIPDTFVYADRVLCSSFFMVESSEALLQMLEEGQNQRKITQKRIKFQDIMEKGEEDGISALPDCLLVEILSRLPSTKEAIRTGTLSKRWKHIWASVPTLVFTDSDHRLTQCSQNPNSMSEFALSVDKTLGQCRQLNLRKFEVHTFYDIRFESQYSNWIRYAISCNVEDLDLEFWGTETEFLLDQYIFISSCFTDLRLARCKLSPTGAISWENLRSLCLSGVNVDQDLIVNIISGSPLLETLVLEYCEWPDITSESDTESESESESEFESESEGDIIGINAPTSLSLTQCRDQLMLKKFKVCTSFNIKVQVQLNDWICYAIRCNVKELNLEFWDAESEDEFMLDQVLYTSSCLTELTIDGCMLNPIGEISWKSLRTLYITGCQSLDEDLIENILSGSPVLETLVLDDCYGYRRLNITSNCVKNLVLSGYKDPYGEDEADIIEINAPNILSLTIKNCLVLRKLLLLNVSSLVKANLNYTCIKPEHRKNTTPKEAEQEMLKGYMINLRHVKELEIGFLCSKAISCLQAKGLVVPSNVKLTGVR